MRGLLALGAIFGLSHVGVAAESINLTFSDSHPRLAWVSPGLPTSAPSNPAKLTGLAGVLPGDQTPSDGIVCVWDQTTGTVATKPLAQIKSHAWDVPSSAYKYLANVRVTVEHDGKAVSAANVLLNDGSRTQTVLLDRTTDGKADFFLVQTGSASVQVQYRTSSGMATPVNQTFKIAADPLNPAQTLKIAVPESTETIDDPSAHGPSAGDRTADGMTKLGGSTIAVDKPEIPAKPEPKSNPLVTFIVIVVTLAGVGFVGLKGIEYLRNNPDKARQTLEQLGASIPKPADDPLNVGTPNMQLPAPAPPAPAPKIMLDPSAANLSDGVPLAPSSVGFSVATTGVPRLRGSHGDSVDLQDMFTVGRDAGLSLSLIADSSVSRRHAEIVRRPEGWVLRDLGSTNGTFVNGAKLQGETLLRAGDEIRFGTAPFRFEA